jgi:hypothetical protein
MGWTLADIRQKVRRVTGRLSSAELTNDQIDTYINNYYQYTFPAELKLDYENTYYEFLTSANQPTYDVPVAWVEFSTRATMDYMILDWYQEPDEFHRYNPETILRSTPWTGDGSTTAFSTTVSATDYPIMPDSLVVTDDTEVFQDTNQTYSSSTVAITGSEGGTGIVNYSTGAISVTFNTAPSDGQDIRISYQRMTTGRPTAVLFYNKQFQFYPIPDTAYRFKIKGYQTFTALASSSSTPSLEQWGPLIAYGASRDIHADYSEMEAYAEVTALYKEQLRYASARTYNMLDNQRAKPQF